MAIEKHLMKTSKSLVSMARASVSLFLFFGEIWENDRDLKGEKNRVEIGSFCYLTRLIDWNDYIAFEPKSAIQQKWVNTYPIAFHKSFSCFDLIIHEATMRWRKIKNFDFHFLSDCFDCSLPLSALARIKTNTNKSKSKTKDSCIGFQYIKLPPLIFTQIFRYTMQANEFVYSLDEIKFGFYA